jgi:hypothetical protein
MKIKVVVSLETAKGDRCVDILCHDESKFSYRECQRDPDGGRGWRYQAEAEPVVFNSYEQALSAVRGSVGWLSD